MKFVEQKFYWRLVPLRAVYVGPRIENEMRYLWDEALL